MPSLYSLKIRSPLGTATCTLNARTLQAAKSLAYAWREYLDPETFKLEITNERGETEWTL